MVDSALEDTSFVGEIKAERRVPFTFCDVNFDGKNEFLVIHAEYNNAYYQVFERNKKGLFVLREDPPYNEFYVGYNSSIDFNSQNEEIEIHYGDAMSAYSKTYKMRKDGTRRFKYVALDTLVHPDSNTYDIYHYEIMSDKRKLISIEHE